MMIFLILTACSKNEKLATENGPDGSVKYSMKKSLGPITHNI